jgi:hypothetical protein
MIWIQMWQMLHKIFLKTGLEGASALKALLLPLPPGLRDTTGYVYAIKALITNSRNTQLLQGWLKTQEEDK